MTQLLRQVALVPDDNMKNALKLSQLTKVGAALQKQVTRDFGPLWDVTATVDSFESLDDVPLGYWPILVGEEGQNGGGVHLNHDNQPYALVDFTPDWTVTASHECLEMLADPFGNRLVAGDSPNPARPGRVEFLVEVCDPCEVPGLGYTVNGIRVSDFYTPHFFDPVQTGNAATSRLYDLRGHISAPRQVLRGGYLSWREADGTWFQELFFGARPTFKSLGHFDKGFGSLRSWIDAHTLQERTELMRQRADFPQQALVRLAGVGEDNNMAGDASKRRADVLRQEIKTMRRTVKTFGANGTTTRGAGRAGRRGTRAGRGK